MEPQALSPALVRTVAVARCPRPAQGFCRPQLAAQTGTGAAGHPHRPALGFLFAPLSLSGVAGGGRESGVLGPERAGARSGLPALWRARVAVCPPRPRAGLERLRAPPRTPHPEYQDRATLNQHALARPATGNGGRLGQTARPPWLVASFEPFGLPGAPGLGLGRLPTHPSGTAGSPDLHRHGGAFLRTGRPHGADLGHAR